MIRREAIAALVAIGAAAGLSALRAQSRPSPQSRRLGILAPASAQDAERFFLGVLRTELKSLGWIEGQNLTIEGAFADFKVARLPALAEELVRKRVDVIWAGTGPAAVAAARTTRTSPIVFTAVAWPVETGLIDSFARPGRNVTGVSTYTGIEVSTKRIEFLKEIAPTATRLSWILDSSMEAPAVAGSPMIFAARERIAAFAVRNRLPSAAASAWFVDAGGLLSYDDAGVYTASVARSAEYVDRIFRGASPADLPVDRPGRYELVINLKTARALGLQIPQAVLLREPRWLE